MATLYRYAPIVDSKFVPPIPPKEIKEALVELVDADGAWLTVKNVQPENPTAGFQLPELYKMLECEVIEVINLRNGTILICDEMPPEDSPANPGASVLYRRIGGSFIVGNALLCKDSELK